MIKDDILAIVKRVHVIDFNFIPRACNLVAHLLSRCPNFLGVNFIPKNILTTVSKKHPNIYQIFIFSKIKKKLPPCHFDPHVDLKLVMINNQILYNTLFIPTKLSQNSWACILRNCVKSRRWE